MRVLYNLTAGQDDGPRVAGIRVPSAHGPGWDAFVAWSPPTPIDLIADSVEFRWVASWDSHVKAAASELSVRLPRHSPHGDHAAG
jgi:hypothetical protein